MILSAFTMQKTMDAAAHLGGAIGMFREEMCRLTGKMKEEAIITEDKSVNIDSTLHCLAFIADKLCEELDSIRAWVEYNDIHVEFDSRSGSSTWGNIKLTNLHLKPTKHLTT